METGFQGPKIMNCLTCRQAELINGFTSLTLKRAEMILVVNSVPARICPACDEAYVEEEVTARLLSAADETSTQGIREAVREYVPARV